MFAAIDIGGSNVRVAAFDSMDKPRIVQRREFAVLESYELTVANLVGTIDELFHDEQLEAIGIGIAGTLSEDGLGIVDSGNLAQFHGRSLVTDLATQYRFNRPISLRNDAVTAAMGESRFGTVEDDFWYLIWGTGFGGAFGFATPHGRVIVPSEPGHQVIDLDTPVQCGCGQDHDPRFGHLEGFVGGSGIKRRLNKAGEDLTDEEFREVLRYFTIGASNLVQIHPTCRTLVMGGGISFKRWSLIQQHLSPMVEAHLSMAPVPAIIPATFGLDDGLFGALAVAEEAWKYAEDVKVPYQQ